MATFDRQPSQIIKHLATRFPAFLLSLPWYHTLFALSTGFLIVVYLVPHLIKLQLSTIPSFGICLGLYLLLPSSWILISYHAASKSAANMTLSLQRNSLPFLAFIPLLLLIPEYFLTTPSFLRILFSLSLCMTIFYFLNYYINTPKMPYSFSFLGTRSKYMVFAIIALQFVISTTSVILRHYHYNPVLGEDTAYYNQIFWNTLHGNFFQGSINQARYFDPPINTDFSMHNSPILLFILPFYRIYPSFFTLLILRNIIISLSCIPLYLLVKERSNQIVALIFICIYFVYPNVFYQSINGFQPLQLAFIFLPFAFFFFFTERFPLFLIFLILSLSVREEISLITVLFGVYAFFLKRKWSWVIVPITLSALWWYISTELIMTHSKIAFEDLQPFYQSFGKDRNEVLKKILTDPLKFSTFLTNQSLIYLYELFKPTLALPFFSPVILFALPTFLINCVVGIFVHAMMSTAYHYSVIVTIVIFIATAHSFEYIGKFCRLFSIERGKWQISIVLILLPISVLGFKDIVQYGSRTGQVLIGDFLPNPNNETIKKIINMIDDNSRVAAPSILLPQLSYRKEAYDVTRFWRYNNPIIDYAIIDIDTEAFSDKDRNKEKYTRVVDFIQNNVEYELIFKENNFAVYKAKHTPGS